MEKFKKFVDTENNNRAIDYEDGDLIAEYDAKDYLVLLEVICKDSPLDSYFQYSVMKKNKLQSGITTYEIVDEIELQNEIDGVSYNNNLLKLDLEKEMKKYAER